MNKLIYYTKYIKFNMKKKSIRTLVEELQRQRARMAKLEAQVKKTQHLLLSQMAGKDELRVQWDAGKDCVVEKKISKIREFSARAIYEVLGVESFSVLHVRAGKVDKLLPTLPEDKKKAIESSLAYKESKPYIQLFFVKHTRPKEVGGADHISTLNPEAASAK